MALIALLFMLVLLVAAHRRFTRRGGRVSRLILAFIAWRWAPERIDRRQAQLREARKPRDRVSPR